MTSRADEQQIHPARAEFGSVRDAVRVDAAIPRPRGGEFRVNFEEDDLLRLLDALDELGIEPDSRFFREAAFAAIEAKRAEADRDAIPAHVSVT